MRRYRTVIAPDVAAVIRRLHPDLKRSIKNALRALSGDPSAGQPLRRELQGLWKFRVRRFRIIYAVDRSCRVIQVVAVGHRRTIYEELAAARTGGGRAGQGFARRTRRHTRRGP